MKNKIKVGIIGFGTVGRGVFELLREMNLPDIELSAIAERNPGKLPSELRHLYCSSEEIVSGCVADIVAEVTNTESEAFELVKNALLNGVHVVSANKKMLCRHFSDLQSAAEKGKSILRYEAAALASVPVFRVLEEYYSHEPVVSFRGIFNGTCNYLLGRMETDSLSFEELLSDAQQLGFAEADPSDDIDGFDAKYKLLLLINQIWNVNPENVYVNCQGIRELHSDDVKLRLKSGWRYKLVARAEKTAAGIIASVQPELVEPNDPLYHCSAENNILQISGAWSGAQYYAGRGAGSLPTGKAVAEDMLKIARQRESRQSLYYQEMLHSFGNN